MSSAVFILMINVSVAALLSITFLVIANYDKAFASARWICAAYAIGAVYYASEFLIAHFPASTAVATASYSALLVALAAYGVGIARKYDVRPPWRMLALLLVASILLNLYTQTLPRELILRNVLWQLPYAAIQAVSIWVLLHARRLGPLDRGLVGALGLSSIYFVVKPLVAVEAGGPGGTAGSYLDSVYALISQSTGIILAIAVALMTLAVYVGKMLSDATLKSETDTLSGLLNRRGFVDRADEILRTADRSGGPVTLILADIDHFKNVNDTYGHEAGDRVIQAFAGVMREVAGEEHAIGRIGGEEFAIVLSGTELSTARLIAEGARVAFSQSAVEGLADIEACTASFGVAQRHAGESYEQLLRCADIALYEAKNAGRDCVRTAPPVIRPNGNGDHAENRRMFRDKR
ncbi:GGDEF domain-containing protein [Mesorhizobium australicum]|uniref:diguanylate cyclase n=1 Tax=Mesorhizobium australicum TaxID=536018 RepID=A0A1X7PZT2_9HYPH|nr:GGDEF domain-containing protein [Mesorhizobium australicum]SMH57355.1 diguanylate cyclase (GGDEF) domain-containing protein [Mesorhizobium australicum]